MNHRSNSILLTPQREPSRIYITSPSFGIDLSVPWLSAAFERRYEECDFMTGIPMRVMASQVIRESYHLNIEFGLGDIGAFLHVRNPINMLEQHQQVFLLQEDIPPLPERPIWLPPGCWECVYCSTTQNADLLQCRSCGAPRIGEDARRCWGHSG